MFSVKVAGWPPFGKELPIRLAVCSHCILSIFNFSYFPFGFDCGVWFLIGPVPDHCLLVTFLIKGIISLEEINTLKRTESRKNRANDVKASITSFQDVIKGKNGPFL